jgi:branched-chain amino acid transport system permease protein
MSTTNLVVAGAAGVRPHSAGGRRIQFLAELAATPVLLLLPVLLSGTPYVLRIVLDVAIWSILAFSLTLIFGFTGQISLGQAVFFAIGAYGAALLQTKLSVPFPIAWILAVLLAMGVAFLVALPLLRIHGHFLALGTLALGLILTTLLVQMRDVTNGYDGVLMPSFTFLGAWLTQNFGYIVLGLFALAYWLVRNLTSRGVGRALFALRDDPAGAAALGIPVTRYKTLVFMIGGGLAGLAGVLYAHHSQVITPEAFTFDASIHVLLIVVIGGMSSRVGAVLGAAVVVALPELLQSLQDPKQLIFALIVLAVLLFMPGGLVGGLVLMWRRIIRYLARQKEARA